MKLKTLLHRLKLRILSTSISLRVIVSLGVSLPVLILFTLLLFFHYRQEYRLLEEQQRFLATQLGSVLSHSLSHSLRTKDASGLIATLSKIGDSDNVTGILIIGKSGDILFANDMNMRKLDISTSNEGCRDCHISQSIDRPRTLELGSDDQVMRIVTPINNSPECFQCHSPDTPIMGVLVLDVSLEELHAMTLHNLKRDIGVSMLAIIFLTIGTVLLVHLLVVRRIEVFRTPMSAYAAGDFSARIPARSTLKDEISELASTFNQMADEISLQAQRQEDRYQLQQSAIIQERERIGRELHDGLAQVLGYVATKTMAVRLMLKKSSLEDADKNLLQLEDSARGLLADMRVDILGLKNASQVNSDLVGVLRDYLQRYNVLSERKVEFELPPDGEITLDPVIVLQLTRIAQEALVNVRKHANATQVHLNLKTDGVALTLEVKDNGCGFDAATALNSQAGRFGLSTMQERAKEIGAELTIHSKPGMGTSVLVRLTPDYRSL